MREKKTFRRIWRRGSLHAYVQSQLRSKNGKALRYRSVGNMASAQEAYVRGAEQVSAAIAEMFTDFSMQIADSVAQEMDWLKEELFEKNPWAEAGPSDPPLHSAEAWKFGFREGKAGQFVLSISNPKDYMQFLEEGWSPQAPAGWIAATYREFWLRLDRSVRRIS